MQIYDFFRTYQLQKSLFLAFLHFLTFDFAFREGKNSLNKVQIKIRVKFSYYYGIKSKKKVVILHPQIFEVMAKKNNLVIVESPAKAKTIERFLGEGYKVMSSFGHIRDLKKKNFGVNLDTFLPEYEIPADKKHIVTSLQTEAKKADTVWLASDEDREGEAIAWHLANVLKMDPKTARRIVFHEITKPAILEAIEHPRTIDMGLVDAQQARRVLDRLVGFRLSPVLWRRVRAGLSAGRVQSVAVRLIVEREREIMAFESEASYRVTAAFTTSDGQTLNAALAQNFKTEKEALDFLEACKDAEFTVSDVQKTPMTRTPMPPFTTSTLQQEAARKLNFPVAVTMRVAQSLYENGLITYMRTDSVNLSKLCLGASKKVIEGQMGAKYHKSRNFTTQSKGAQEAHEAIRPTDMSRETIKGTSQEQKLYNLIWKRTIATQMADAKLERTTMTFSISNRPEVFKTQGDIVLFDGFLKVYRNADDEQEENMLPQVKNGEILTRKKIKAQERYSQPPQRFTEATLVHRLEELGIGRPSTYAPTISTIQQREYVVRGDKAGEERLLKTFKLDGNKIKEGTAKEKFGADKGKLLPTDTGIVVTDFLLENFPEIMDYNFTAHVEEDFDDVAEGKKDWTSLIRDFYGPFDTLAETAMQSHSDHRVGERILGNDPKTGEPVSVKIGRFGPMAQIGVADENTKPRFATLKPGWSMETVTLEQVLELFKLPKFLGEFEGFELKVNAGRFGPYIQFGPKSFVSVPKGEDPLDMTYKHAVELINAYRSEEAKTHLKKFDEDADLEVRQGRYGAYLSYKGENYKLPKNLVDRAAELTYEECMKVVEAGVSTYRKKKK